MSAMAGVDHHQRTARKARVDHLHIGDGRCQIDRQRAAARFADHRGAPIGLCRPGAAAARQDGASREASSGQPGQHPGLHRFQSGSSLACPCLTIRLGHSYHADMVNAELSFRRDKVAQCNGCGGCIAVLVHRQPIRRLSGRARAAANHATRPSRLTLHDATGRFPPALFRACAACLSRENAGMVHEAEAFPALATDCGNISPNVALTIARRPADRPAARAQGIFNDHAHADRRAPSRGNSGRRRQGNPDRGI